MAPRLGQNQSPRWWPADQRVKVGISLGVKNARHSPDKVHRKTGMRNIPSPRLRALIQGLTAAAFVWLCASHAQASEPKDRVICTAVPPSAWMSETEARQRFHAEEYMLVRFKISSENCHEFYAVTHDGSVVEAYVHPVTGEVVRLTRIALPTHVAPKPTAPQASTR